MSFTRLSDRSALITIIATAFRPFVSLFEPPRNYAITAGDGYPSQQKQTPPRAPDTTNVQYNRRLMSR